MSTEKLTPEELERRQKKLLDAALKGRKAFDQAWDEIFHPKKPSPADDPETTAPETSSNPSNPK
jgi:hypothetical protein